MSTPKKADDLRNMMTVGKLLGHAGYPAQVFKASAQEFNVTVGVHVFSVDLEDEGVVAVTHILTKENGDWLKKLAGVQLAQDPSAVTAWIVAQLRRAKVGKKANLRWLKDLHGREYGPKSGLEGPFLYRTGVVLYYDSSEGAYYDPTTDMYLSEREFRARAGEQQGSGRPKKAKDLPADVERYVKEIKESQPGKDDSYYWAVAWSRYCKYKEPGSEHCKQDNYFPGREASTSTRSTKMSDQQLRNKIIRLAHKNPELRGHLLPILASTEEPSGERMIADRLMGEKFVVTLHVAMAPKLPKKEPKWLMDVRGMVVKDVKETMTGAALLKEVHNTSKMMALALAHAKHLRLPGGQEAQLAKISLSARREDNTPGNLGASFLFQTLSKKYFGGDSGPGGEPLVASWSAWTGSWWVAKPT